MAYVISAQDRAILRELAKKQLELANREENKRRIKEWYLHNALQGEKPMIHLEMGSFEQEIIPDRMRCEGAFARTLEKKLLCNFLNQELFDDDRVTPDYFPMNYDTHFNLFNIPVKVDHVDDGKGNVSVGHHFVPTLRDLEEDWEKIGETDFGVDIEATEQKKAAAEEVFGDILPVRLQMDCLYSVPTQMLVHIMSMEDMMFNMYDYPDLFKQLMDRIAEDTLAY